MSKSMFRSFQQMCELNIQLAQTLVEETTLAGQQVLSAERQTEVISAAASRAQPTGEKLRAYHQHVSRLAADSQAELARVTEQHVQNTSRTVRALVDEVARTSTEETERSMHEQREAMRSAADPFARPNGSGDAAMGSNGDGQRSQQGAQYGQGAQANRPSVSATH
jgi:phasin family protein